MALGSCDDAADWLDAGVTCARMQGMAKEADILQREAAEWCVW